MKNLYGALDQGEEGDIVARSIVCCKGGAPVAMPPPPQPTPIKPKPVSAQDGFNLSRVCHGRRCNYSIGAFLC